MSLGSWDPSIGMTDSNIQLQPALLERLIAYSRADQLPGLEQVLSDTEKQEMAGLMQVDHDQWRTAAEPLSNDELLHLIRFFAVAENLPGWEAGDKSPVIPLARVLRKRGAKLEKELLQWLRTVNNNRFLPYGPL